MDAPVGPVNDCALLVFPVKLVESFRGVRGNYFMARTARLMHQRRPLD
jgi:hypothetical protein